MGKKTLTDAADLLEQAALILSANYFRVEAERVATLRSKMYRKIALAYQSREVSRGA